MMLSSKHKEPTLSDYDAYLKSTPSVDQRPLTDPGRLREYRVTVVHPEHEHRKHQYKLILHCIANSGKIVHYTARVGQFELKLAVLHESIAYPSEPKNKVLGAGGFGTISEKSICSDEFVTKVVKYYEPIRKPTKENVEAIIQEVAMYKLCAFLGIGPRLETRIPFDVIFYSDCAQFHMEKCLQYTDKAFRKRKECVEEDLKRCLKTLHHYHIVHRDIKPANILLGKGGFIFTDFGLTHIIKETP